MPVSAAIADLAAGLRAHHALRTPDALHVATALATGCDAFLTNDATLRRVTALPVISLASLAIEE